MIRYWKKSERVGFVAREVGCEMDTTDALLRFIAKSPTAFQAVDEIACVLEEKGYRRLEEGKPWTLSRGQGYYVTRNASSLIAFRLPDETPRNFMISAVHTDSPMFKLKKDHLLFGADDSVRLATEPYGGMIHSSWLDRPLSVAGRVVLCRDGTFEAKNVMLDRDLLVIPNVAIHFNRSINAGYAYNPATDLVPLFAEGKEASLNALLAETLGCREEEIVGADLFVYNRMAGTVLGASGEFFAAPRIDDLMCAWGCLDGFVNSCGAKDCVSVYFAADNEETGSATKQGAGSVFLSDVLDRICEYAGTDRRCMLASSMMVSADNAHARHPNHPELSDAQNSPHMNGGVVIKSNASQKYTTDGISSAIFEKICRDAGVPVQHFHNRSDIAGGSTLGSISNTNVPLLSVDIGMAQLAMHSAYETAGSRDVEYLSRAMRAFYESRLCVGSDGSFCLHSLKNN